MIPGLGGMNPAKMKQMMKQLGINQEEIEAVRVTIEKVDGTKTIIEPAGVVKIVMQGQESWQVTGEAREEVGSVISDEDVQLVMDKTGKSEKEVRAALEEYGDIAEAIVKLSE